MANDTQTRSGRYIISWILWPAMLIGSMLAVLRGLAAGMDPVLTLLLVYFGLVATIALLERLMPHDPSWNANDGQVANDLFHTFTSYFVLGALVEAGVIVLIAKLVLVSATLSGFALWPVQWPLAAQFVLLLLVAEIGAYTAHRLSHKVPLLWRFHAMHHSAPSLYWLNTGRFHLIDVIETIVLALPLPLLLGAPAGLMFLFTCITMFIGVLSHCNIEMRFGLLDWLFNTPGVHRWHHSPQTEESDANYGENLMVYDVLLGTHYRPNKRPYDIGNKTAVPASIWGQLIRPFTGYREGPGTLATLSQAEAGAASYDR